MCFFVGLYILLRCAKIQFKLPLSALVNHISKTQNQFVFFSNMYVVHHGEMLHSHLVNLVHICVCNPLCMCFST